MIPPCWSSSHNASRFVPKEMYRRLQEGDDGFELQRFGINLLHYAEGGGLSVRGSAPNPGKERAGVADFDESQTDGVLKDVL